MYVRFRYSRKIRCGLRSFGVLLCGFAVSGPPLRPPRFDLVPLRLLSGVTSITPPNTGSSAALAYAATNA